MITKYFNKDFPSILASIIAEDKNLYIILLISAVYFESSDSFPSEFVDFNLQVYFNNKLASKFMR